MREVVMQLLVTRLIDVDEEILDAKDFPRDDRGLALSQAVPKKVNTAVNKSVKEFVNSLSELDDVTAVEVVSARSTYTEND